MPSIMWVGPIRSLQGLHGTRTRPPKRERPQPVESRDLTCVVSSCQPMWWSLDSSPPHVYEPVPYILSVCLPICPSPLEEITHWFIPRRTLIQRPHENRTQPLPAKPVQPAAWQFLPPCRTGPAPWGNPGALGWQAPRLQSGDSGPAGPGGAVKPAPPDSWVTWVNAMHG